MNIEELIAKREFNETVFNELIIQIMNNNLSQSMINPDDAETKLTSLQKDVLQSIKRCKKRIIK